TLTKTGISALTLTSTSSIGSLSVTNLATTALGSPASTVTFAGGQSLSIGSGSGNSLAVGNTTAATHASGKLDASGASSFTVNVGTVSVGTTANSGGNGGGLLMLPVNSTITASTSFLVGNSGGSRNGDMNMFVGTVTRSGYPAGRE